MSRGLGSVQRRLLAIIQAEPTRRFEVEELAALAFPGQALGRSHLASVRRALKGLELFRCRVGWPGGRGWRYVVSATS
jgi:hypothetical protein